VCRPARGAPRLGGRYSQPRHDYGPIALAADEVVAGDHYTLRRNELPA
jgi:hypothetical protein